MFEWSINADKPQSSRWKLVKKNIQLGRDFDWLTVASDRMQGFSHAVTLKGDGSIWKWSFSDDPRTNSASASATRLSARSDWVAVTEGMGGIIGLAADGSLWLWHVDSRNRYVQTLLPVLAPSRRPQLLGNIFARPAQ
jgi:hypothetical protein